MISTEKTLRSTQDGPFCWLNKDVLRLISEKCGDRSDKPHVIAVYLVLCWEASNQQTEAITISKRAIASLAGISYRKAADTLSFLASIGVIAIDGNHVAGAMERAPNTYSMLGILCPRLGTECSRLGMRAERAQFAEIIEESKKNNTRSTSAPAVKASKKGQNRSRDVIIDALASIECPDLAQVTQGAWKRFAKARKDIATATPDVTPEEIQRRTAAYRRKYRDVPITAMALANRWGEFPVANNSRTSSGPTYV